MSKHGAARQSFHFQFVTTPTSDTSGTVLHLHFNDQRYVFGRVAEGTQRACIQRGVGVRKVHNIFLTGQTTWQTNGGLIGMILTLADVQKAEEGQDGVEKRSRLNIHGGPKLMHTLACSRRFVFRTGMPISVLESSPDKKDPLNDPTWSDENIQTWALPIKRTTPGDLNSSPLHEEYQSVPGDVSSESELDPDETSPPSSLNSRAKNDQGAQNMRAAIIQDMFDSDWRRDRLVEVPFNEVNFPAIVFVRDPITKELAMHRCDSIASLPHLPTDMKVQIRNPWPASLVGELPPTDKVPRIAMSYIIKGYPQRGRFDPEKAKQLGVPKGPLYSTLTRGTSVQLEDGTTITPEMVLGPGKPGRGIAIIDLPDRGFVPDLLQRSELKDPAVMEGIGAIVWILNAGVILDEAWQKFIALRPHLEHIISSPDVCPNYLAMESSAASAIRLSRVWKDVFPVPIHDNVTVPQNKAGATYSGHDVFGQSNHIPADRGLKINIEPKFEISTAEAVPFLNTGQVIREIPKTVLELAARAVDECSKHGTTVSSRDPEIITLGTGSAAPSKYRNVSSTLLRIPGQGSYLFDCGENTLGQLSRLFNPDELDRLLTDLRMIWISHLHADHHLGTTSLLRAQISAHKRLSRRFGGSGAGEALPKIFVVGEKHLAGFLQDFASVQNFKNVKRVVASPEGLTVGGKPFSFGNSDSHVPIKEFRTGYVSHCWGAQSVSVTFQNGFKFSYSGDCRPSEYFTKIGSGSDVLVHEATFDDGMEGDALAKKHCTTAEALAVGATMGAKNVILTHFSQRYQKIPVMSDVKLPSHIRFEEGNGQNADLAASAGDEEAYVEDRGSLNNTPTQTTNPPGSMPVELKDTPPLDMNICVAFDYMKIKVSQIKKMQHFTPALQALFDVERKVEEGPTENQKTNRERYENANRKKSKGGQPQDHMNGEEEPQQKSKKQIRQEADRQRMEDILKEAGRGKRAKLTPDIILHNGATDTTALDEGKQLSEAAG